MDSSDTPDRSPSDQLWYVKSTRLAADNPKTVVVAVVGTVVVAISRAAVVRIVVPRTAAQQPDVPVPSSGALMHRKLVGSRKHKLAE